MRLIAVSGSLRRASTNGGLIRAVVAAAAADGDVAVDVFDGLEAIPHYNADRDDLAGGVAPPEVLALRRRVAAADGVVIATPEYAHSLPGALKDALDWLVGSGELADRPVAVLSASTTGSGGLNAQAALTRTLLAQSATIVATLPVGGVRRKSDADGTITDPATLGQVADALAVSSPPAAAAARADVRDRRGPGRTPAMNSFDSNPGVPQDDTALWSSIIEDVRDDPAEGLPELVRILGDELRGAGLPLDDPTAMAGAQPDVAADWRELEEVVALLADGRAVGRPRLRNGVRVAESLHRIVVPAFDQPEDDALEPLEAEAEAAIELEERAGEIGETTVD